MAWEGRWGAGWRNPALSAQLTLSERGRGRRAGRKCLHPRRRTSPEAASAILQCVLTGREQPVERVGSVQAWWWISECGRASRLEVTFRGCRRGLLQQQSGRACRHREVAGFGMEAELPRDSGREAGGCGISPQGSLLQQTRWPSGAARATL